MAPPYPYANAPRLAAQGPIDVSGLTASQTGDLEVEVGPGRGGFILERAQERPDARLVGLEIRWKWATVVDERLGKRGWGDRARVYAEDARLVLPRLQPSACVSAFFVHFPDPWWKARQRKRLVVNPALLDQVQRLLVPHGMLFVQTDVIERAQTYETMIAAHGGFVPNGDKAGTARIESPSWQAKGNRERRAESDGIPVYRLRYQRAATTPTY